MPLVHDDEHGAVGARPGHGRPAGRSPPRWPPSSSWPTATATRSSCRRCTVARCCWSPGPVGEGVARACPGGRHCTLSSSRKGVTVVTVALDVEPANAIPWIDAAAPTHPSLIDTTMVTTELFGFANVPMAVAIDEEGMLVRPAELASIEVSPLRDAPDPRRAARPPQADAGRRSSKFPGDPTGYRAGIVDWVERGAASPFALSPDEVVARIAPRGRRRSPSRGLLRAGPGAVPPLRQRRRRAVVARGAPPRQGQLGLQAPGLVAGHDEPRASPPT